MRSLLHPLLFAGLLLLPAACSQMSPDTRAGIWHPSGVNSRNLAAMMADPSDLVRGREASGSDSPLAIAAVNRLKDNKAKPLPNSTTQGPSLVVVQPPASQGGS